MKASMINIRNYEYRKADITMTEWYWLNILEINAFNVKEIIYWNYYLLPTENSNTLK